MNDSNEIDCVIYKFQTNAWNAKRRQLGHKEYLFWRCPVSLGKLWTNCFVFISKNRSWDWSAPFARWRLRKISGPCRCTMLQTSCWYTSAGSICYCNRMNSWVKCFWFVAGLIWRVEKLEVHCRCRRCWISQNLEPEKTNIWVFLISYFLR